MLVSACAGSGSAVKSTTVPAYVTMPDKSALLQLQHTSPAPQASHAQLVINTNDIYQTMDGFGYTLTGGSALHIMRMSSAARATLLQELFGNGPEGIGVSFLRISIGASDLDELVFSYDDMPAGKTDPELKTEA